MGRIALLWDGRNTIFQKYLLVKGYKSDVISDPRVLSLVSYKLVIVPSGFGNNMYSNMLKQLRAGRIIIERFVRAGGILVACGSISDDERAYDWLPQTIHLRYRLGFERTRIETVSNHAATSLVEADECMCDGFFEFVDGAEVLLKGNKRPILVASDIGKGEIIATTIHEFPSTRFISYCLARVS